MRGPASSATSEILEQKAKFQSSSRSAPFAPDCNPLTDGLFDSSPTFISRTVCPDTEP